MLAPLESVQFVSNLLFAKFVNGVLVTRRMVSGSALIIFGTILAIAFGPSRVLQFSVNDLVGFWGDATWLIYLTLNLSLAFATQMCHVIYERARLRGESLAHSGTVLPVTFGLSSALAGSHCVVQASWPRCAPQRLNFSRWRLGPRSLLSPHPHPLRHPSPPGAGQVHVGAL